MKQPKHYTKHFNGMGNLEHAKYYANNKLKNAQNGSTLTIIYLEGLGG